MSFGITGMPANTQTKRNPAHFLMGCFFRVTARKRAIRILIDFLLHNIIIIGTPLQT